MSRARWGQNFLVDAGMCRRIVEWAGIEGRDVLEIGPGRGAITDLLLERASRLALIEIDPVLAALWRGRARADDRLELIEGDALEVDLGSAVTAPTTVVANLPYESGTAIVQHLLDQPALFERIVVMLQDEVCGRLLAREGGKAYGLLAVHVQLRADVERGFHVAPGCFRPRPRVDSRMVRLTPLGRYRHDVGDIETFSRLVACAFGQRRKMVRNTLGAWLDKRVGAEQAAALLAEAEIDPRARPETIALEQFARLSSLVSPLIIGPTAHDA